MLAVEEFPTDFARAYSEPSITGVLKAECEDFRVTEQLGFELSGEGEHLYLWIEKRNMNTRHVVELLAQWAGLKPMDVGYAGMKDKQAITRQWFSLYLGNKPDPDLSELPEGNYTVLEHTRHRQKLRRGMHQGNAFEIRLTQLNEGEVVDEQALTQRLEQVAESGVPNYFGEQRFGHHANNLNEAHRMLIERCRVKRSMKGIYLSAARSYLFNRVLSARIEQGSWQQLLAGDVATETGFPTGPMWGRGRSATAVEALAVEQAALADRAD